MMKEEPVAARSEEATNQMLPGMTIDPGKINRSEVSRQTGTNIAHISRILTGQARPSVLLLRRILEALQATIRADITLDELDRNLRILEAAYKDRREARRANERRQADARKVAHQRFLDNT